MGIMIAYHGYNNGYNNLLYDVHRNVGVHSTQEHIYMAKYGNLFIT